MASNPGVDAICVLSLLLVLFFASRGFSPGTPVFPSRLEPTIPKSNSIWNTRTHFNEFLSTPKCSVGKQIYYSCNLVTGTGIPSLWPLVTALRADEKHQLIYLEASSSILKQAVVIENTTLLTLIYASAYKHVHTWLLFSSARVGRLPI